MRMDSYVLSVSIYGLLCYLTVIDKKKLQVKMVSELHELLICMHHAIGYFDTVTVLDHPTHACIACVVTCV